MSDAVDGDRSLGQLVASATSEMSALIHDEIALAKAQLRKDVTRGGIGSLVAFVAVAVFIFSLPMLSFALAYGINSWTGGFNGSGGWNLAWCFLLSFAASVALTLLLGLVAWILFKKAQKDEGRQKVAASAKETAAVLGNVKPHPRPVTASARGELTRAVEDAKPVARSSS
ncbi:phage holin family protein [Streptomyces sp. TRM66268-LWL]|uniref:Phage holin family protein n=1 Tax=Streptomyces polyasparticus TaxID=2767826 RepID=A0ABR7SGN7_9ACTN|nr:phage holin family protein [Streptomyces polyasparticus]MBC9714661.1 phage holin family protein [Streptomyces polyasparticus]